MAINVARAARVRELRALHVFFDASTVRFDEHLEEILGKEEEQFQQFVARVDTAGIEVEPIYHESTRPSQAILRVAERCGSDLVVMNMRGRSQAAFVLLGSNTSESAGGDDGAAVGGEALRQPDESRPGDLEPAALGPRRREDELSAAAIASIARFPAHLGRLCRLESHAQAPARR